MSEQGFWTPKDLKAWTDALKVSNVLPRGGRQRLKHLDSEDTDETTPLPWETVETILTQEAIEAGLSGNLDWYEENLLAQRLRPSQFPLTVARLRGADILKAPPKLVVGTIHSVKGSEADVVYLFPDLSRPAWDEWTGDIESQAAVYRLFYVGMTRAKEHLVLCNNATSRSVDF